MAREIEDYEIRNQVRSILLRFWINTEKLNIGVHRGNVSLFGFLEENSSVGRTNEEIKNMERLIEKNASSNTSKSANFKASRSNLLKKISLIEQEIQGISGVRCVTLEIQNAL